MTTSSTLNDSQWKAVPDSGALTGGFEDGAVGAPSIKFTDDTDTGFYRVSADKIACVGNGTKMWESDYNGNQNTTTFYSTSATNYVSINNLASANITLDDSFNGYNALVFKHSASTKGSIVVTSTATAYNTSSDYRLKENIVPLTNAVTRVKQLTPCRFNFTSEPSVVVDGFLAHEVTPVVPEAVAGTKDAVDDEGNPIYQGIDQSKLVPLLVAAVQELTARVEALESV